MRQELARRLRRAREAIGLTQDEVAERLQVNRVQVSRWENGVRPRDDALQQLADLYEVTVEWLHGAPLQVSSGTESATTEAEVERARMQGRLEGAFEATIWSTERVTAELHAILRDARLQLRTGQWDPPGRDVEPPGSYSVPALRELRVAAPASATYAPLPDEAQRRERQLKRIETILGELEEESGLPGPATVQSTLSLEERLQVLGRAVARLRGENPTTTEDSPSADGEGAIQAAR